MRVCGGWRAPRRCALCATAAACASVARCADVDVEIQRLAKKPSKANVTHDTSLQCGRWALTGACARRPLFMHSRCVVSCLLLGPRYQEAAHSRTPPQLRYLLPQLVVEIVIKLHDVSHICDVANFVSASGVLRSASNARYFLVTGYHSRY